MDEARFFQLIDAARDTVGPQAPSASSEALTEVLDDLGDDELIAFCLEFQRQLIRLNHWDVWGAGYVLAGGMSDDSFHYFRSWIVGKGADAVARALGEPDALVEFVPDDEEEFDNEELEYVVLEVLESRGVEEDPRDELDEFPDDEPAGEPFDEDGVEARFPRAAAWAAAR